MASATEEEALLKGWIVEVVRAAGLDGITESTLRSHIIAREMAADLTRDGAVKPTDAAEFRRVCAMLVVDGILRFEVTNPRPHPMRYELDGSDPVRVWEAFPGTPRLGELITKAVGRCGIRGTIRTDVHEWIEEWVEKRSGFRVRLTDAKTDPFFDRLVLDGVIEPLTPDRSVWRLTTEEFSRQIAHKAADMIGDAMRRASSEEIPLAKAFRAILDGDYTHEEQAARLLRSDPKGG